jgi:uncharacterized membrane protein
MGGGSISATRDIKFKQNSTLDTVEIKRTTKCTRSERTNTVRVYCRFTEKLFTVLDSIKFEYPLPVMAGLYIPGANSS